MTSWPDWNPLSGSALATWLDRERRQYHRAAHIFSFSEATKRSLVEEYDVPPERISVVGAGVNFHELPAVPDPAGPRVGPPTILFVGHDFVRKGGPGLLSAFEIVRSRVPDARLLVVGTSHDVPPQDGVEVLGRVDDRARVAQLFREADVFCMPSVFDPFPLVVLEAMAFALPCVVSDSCGIPEQVVENETAAVVRVGDAPELLADALTDLLLDSDRARAMGQAGRRRVEESFRWTHVVERMMPGMRGAATIGRADREVLQAQV